MNQLFYNIADGIVHQIQREKQTTISEVIVRDGTDATSPFPLFFSFSASFKNSSPREKVTKLSSFWDRSVESLFVSIIVAKYNIFPSLKTAFAQKKCWQIDLLTLCSRYQRALSRF